MKACTLLLMVVLGALLLPGCAHSTRRDSWVLSRIEKDQHPEESIRLEVTSLGGGRWTVVAEALEIRRDHQVWSVRRAFHLGVEQTAHEFFVYVPPMSDHQIRPGEPSEKDLPPELARANPAPMHKPTVKQDAVVQVDWMVVVTKDGGIAGPSDDRLSGQFEGSGKIELASDIRKHLARDLKLGSTIQLRVSAKPIGWGDVDGLTERREVPIGPRDVAEPPEAKPRPRPARANGGLGKP